MMKKNLLFLAAALISVIACAKNEESGTDPEPKPGPEPEPVEVLADSLFLDQTEIAMNVGGGAALTFVTVPEKITESAVWTSGNEKIVTVDSTGTVVGVGAGSTNVTVRLTQSGLTASCSVTVNNTLTIKRIDSAESITKDVTRVNERTDVICVARGEVADFQINVKAEQATTGLTASLLYFCHEDEDTGIALEPELFWVRSVRSSRHWDSWYGAPYNEVNPSDRMFPDPLVPVDEYQPGLNKNENISLWCDFSIPRSFREGLYSGAMLISGVSDGLPTAYVKEFQVRVFPVTLPEKQSLKVINWMYSGFFEPMNNGSHDYDEYEMKGIVMDFMSKYGQNGWLIGDNAPTGPDLSIDNGKIKCDFSRFKSELDFMEEHCPDLDVVEGSAFCSYLDYSDPECTADDMRCPVYFIEDNEIKLRGLPPTDPRTREWFVNLYSQFGEYARTTSLKNGRRIIDVYCQSIMDEPQDRHVSGYDMVASFIREGCPDIHIMEPMETAKLDDRYIDWPCPNLDMLTIKDGEFAARGNQSQWMYCCQRPQGNIANRIFGLKTIKSRIINWCNFYYNAIGYLHWGLNRWDFYYEKDPQSGKREYTSPIFDKDMCLGVYPGGDYFFIWPGYRKLYPSVRLCNMRDGIRDYELLKMVEARDPEMAREFCFRVVFRTPEPLDSPSSESVAGKYKFYDENVVNFRNTRKAMLEYLSE